MKLNTDRKRINVNFSDSAYRVLRERSTARGTTMSAHLRDCIALLRWFDEERLNGSHFLVERDGWAREVIWP